MVPKGNAEAEKLGNRVPSAMVFIYFLLFMLFNIGLFKWDNC